MEDVGADLVWWCFDGGVVGAPPPHACAPTPHYTHTHYTPGLPGAHYAARPHRSTPHHHHHTHTHTPHTPHTTHTTTHAHTLHTTHHPDTHTHTHTHTLPSLCLYTRSALLADCGYSRAALWMPACAHSLPASRICYAFLRYSPLLTCLILRCLPTPARLYLLCLSLPHHKHYACCYTV